MRYVLVTAIAVSVLFPPLLPDTVDDCIKGEPEIAIKACTSLIESENGTAKGHAMAYNARGLSYGMQGDYDKALADFNVAIDKDPKDPWGYSNRALAYEELDKIDEALADYTKASELKTKNASVYVGRAGIYFDDGELDKAIDDYTRAIKLDPKNATAYYNRGLSYDNSGDTKKAITDYTQAIKLNPDNSKAYYNRGLIYFKAKKYEETVKDADQVLRIDPKKANGYILRGKAYTETAYEDAEFDRAIADFDLAIAIEATSALAYDERANAYATRYSNGGPDTDYDKALADYKKAIELMPDDPDFHADKGWLHIDNEEPDLAEAEFQAALKIDPDNSSALDGMDDIKAVSEGRVFKIPTEEEANEAKKSDAPPTDR